MDDNLLLALGYYLNGSIYHGTCSNSLTNTIAWLEANQKEHIDADIEWLHEQGVTCDCQVVVKLYLPAKEKSLKDAPSYTDVSPSK